MSPFGIAIVRDRRRRLVLLPKRACGWSFGEGGERRLWERRRDCSPSHSILTGHTNLPSIMALSSQ